MKLIERPFYLDRLKRLIGTPDIKVITGIRRAGKSKLLEAFKAYVESSINGANVVYVDLTHVEFEVLKEYHALYDYVSSQYKSGASNFVLIDEVQMCEDFEHAVNGLHASGKYDIYITGSNAFLQSSDLATLFTGRTMSIDIFPFSFAEFCSYFDNMDIDDAFTHYFEMGGMSGSYVYADEQDRRNYLSDVFDTLILRDIRQKHRIRYPQLLAQLSDFMMDNVSNISSARSITSAVGKEGLAVSNRTITSYMDYLEQAFAFYRVRRYDIRGKRYLASGDKYYLADHSFRSAKLGRRNLDSGRILENIVAMELLRRGFETYAGVLYKKEIDFVAMRGDEKVYIQVSDDISSPVTFKREYTPLLAIHDAYPKLIIARTKREMYTFEGIEVYDIARWLIGEK